MVSHVPGAHRRPAAAPPDTDGLLLPPVGAAGIAPRAAGRSRPGPGGMAGTEVLDGAVSAGPGAFLAEPARTGRPIPAQFRGRNGTRRRPCCIPITLRRRCRGCGCRGRPGREPAQRRGPVLPASSVLRHEVTAQPATTTVAGTLRRGATMRARAVRARTLRPGPMALRGALCPAAGTNHPPVTELARATSRLPVTGPPGPMTQARDWPRLRDAGQVPATWPAGITGPARAMVSSAITTRALVIPGRRAARATAATSGCSLSLTGLLPMAGSTVPGPGRWPRCLGGTLSGRLAMPGGRPDPPIAASCGWRGGPWPLLRTRPPRSAGLPSRKPPRPARPPSRKPRICGRP